MSHFLIFIFGLSVGSFLNAAIYRFKKKKTILIDRSKCPKCGETLKWYDLIPLLSFIFLLGKCRYCHKKINWQYPLVEIFTGIVFLLIFNFSIFSTDNQFLSLAYYLIIASFLIFIFVYDLKYYLILDKVIYPAIGISILYLIFLNFNSWSSYLFSAVLPAGFFLLLILVSRGEWMGLGDVKLAFLMGLILDYPGILIALFLSFLSGAGVGLFLIASGKKEMKSEIPFGPFLAGSTILVLLFKPFFIDLVNNLFLF